MTSIDGSCRGNYLQPVLLRDHPTPTIVSTVDVLIGPPARSVVAIEHEEVSVFPRLDRSPGSNPETR